MHPIISFDVGIKNLAVCILDQATKTIIDWKVISLVNGPDKNLAVVSDSLIDKLDEMYLSFQDAEEMTVLVENQPAFKNPTMKSVQMIIYSYFRVMSKHQGLPIHIHVISAGSKLRYMKKHFKDMDVSEKSYKKNKQNAIAYTLEYIQNNSPAHVEFFEKNKKKDDLADCLLQALSFFE